MSDFMQHQGIDYSLGQSNVNKSTGVHYGVISSHSVPYEYQDDFEGYYGEPTCPVCGNDAVEASDKSLPEDSEGWDHYGHGCNDYACQNCEHFLDSGDVFSDESLGFSYEREGYKLTNCLDSDIFVLESPFYTRAQFCSPCVPGAGNLETPADNGPKTYCLGHEWFEDEKAPYPVFKVLDDSEVLPESEEDSPEDEQTYEVFVRDWWRMERGRLVPNPGADEEQLATGLDYSEAREMCEEYNSTHEPGELSRKAEFRGE